MRYRYALVLVLAALPVIYWMALTLAALVHGHASKCPNCYSKRIRRAYRRMQDHFLPTRVSPCRCENCRKRFYRLQPVDYRRALSR
jgi:hypothetical protein